MTDTVYFNKAKLERLKSRYKLAVEKNEDTFEFDGKTYVRGYAKYLIEYLESKFKEA